MKRRTGASYLAASILALCAGVVAASPQDPLTVVVDHAEGGRPIGSDERLQLRLSRPLGPADGRVVVFRGRTDLTSLFALDGAILTYRAELEPLPTGPTTLLVYLVSPRAEWLEVARLDLVVEPSQAGGAQAAGEPQRQGTRELVPSLTLSLKGRRALKSSPQETAPPRDGSVDVSLQAGLRAGASSARFVRQGQLDLVGASYRPESLRYGELGEEAPRVDLSSYLVQVGSGGFNFQLGHSTFGAHRYLIRDFSSRGLVATSPLDRPLSVSLTAVNGTSIVGWDNPFGLSTGEHRIFAGTLGLELVPRRPGGARLEVTALDGSLLPRSSYSQSHLSDAEESRGLGARFLVSDAKQRIRLEAGYARSTFDNPTDPLLDQGTDPVPVKAVTRQAYYLDADFQLLRDHQLAAGWVSNVALAVRHGRVDPLFRSVAAYLQADRLSSELQVTANLGEIGLVAGQERSNDNLADVPSILKTFTRRTHAQLTLPFAALAGASKPRNHLLPLVTCIWESTHQFAEALPANGDFDPSAAPDQVSTNSTITADWQFSSWRLGGRFNRSLQDNRQIGRERDDLANSAAGIAASVTLRPGFEVTLDLTSELAHNHATEAKYEIWRGTLGVTLQATRRSVLTLSTGATSEGDVAGSNRSRNLNFDAQWSTSFGSKKPGRWGPEGQIFVRYALHHASSFDRVFALQGETEVQTIDGGVRITLF